jgi:mannosidase alpha-like ER degradation enhancer 1
VPYNFLNNTCTSGAGTLLLEFGMLGLLLDDPIYENLARKTMYSIFSKRSNETGLFGNELNVNTGEWTGLMSGLGAGIDSYFEYMLKVNIHHQLNYAKISLKKTSYV